MSQQFIALQHPRRFFYLVVFGFLTASSVTTTHAAEGDVTRMPGAPVSATANASLVGPFRSTTLKASAAPTRELQLGPLSSAERDRLLAPAAGRAAKRTKVGINRAVPADASGNTAVVWRALPDGGSALLLSISSVGARSVRATLTFSSLPEGAELRAGTSLTDERTTLLGAPALRAMHASGTIWTPLTEGDTHVVEVYVPKGASVADVSVRVGEVAHLVAGPSDGFKRVNDIGRSGACEIDVACVSNASQALSDAAKSVAKMLFASGGSSFLCTGTLLNDTDRLSEVPYFLAANHCIDDAFAASSLQTFWFFQANRCGSLTAGPFATLAGGADLLFTSAETDGTLLRLRNTPPAGGFFAGWDANPVAAGNQAIVLHHPQGDLKKFSSAVVESFAPLDSPPARTDAGIRVRYTQGSTEGGSSGAPLFTSDGTQYYVRGTLTGGDASCSSLNAPDFFGRFDLFFAQPTVKAYLDPDTAAVTEYYNSVTGHYFWTPSLTEMSIVDSGGAGPGWQRTGASWRVVLKPFAGLTPIARFYAFGPNSHFYTPNADEIQILLDIEKRDRPIDEARGLRFQGWQLEGYIGYAALAAGNNCPQGYTPLWRLYNNRFVFNDSNHRFTTDTAIYNQMAAQGWAPEGATMCVIR